MHQHVSNAEGRRPAIALLRALARLVPSGLLRNGGSSRAEPNSVLLRSSACFQSAADAEAGQAQVPAVLDPLVVGLDRARASVSEYVRFVMGTDRKLGPMKALQVRSVHSARDGPPGRWTMTWLRVWFVPSPPPQSSRKGPRRLAGVLHPACLPVWRGMGAQVEPRHVVVREPYLLSAHVAIKVTGRDVVASAPSRSWKTPTGGMLDPYVTCPT